MSSTGLDLADVQREMGINGLDLPETMEYIKEYWPFLPEDTQGHVKEVFVVSEAGASIVKIGFIKGGAAVVA